MYCVDLLFYLLQFAFVVHCMPQPQKPEESSFEKSGLDSVDWNEAYFDDILNGKAHNNYLLSATSPDKDDLSSSIYRKSTDAFPSTCLAPTESRDNNILKDRSIYKYPNKNGMCSVLRIHSSVEDEGSHRVFPVIPVDDKQGMTELRGKPDLNICSEAGFPDRPIPVCPSPLPGSVLIFDDGTMLLEFATSTFSVHINSFTHPS